MKQPEPIPPRLATRLLLYFLRDDLAEEVVGDLEEKFCLTARTISPSRAKINYWYQVLHYVRPFAIRKRSRSTINQYDMFRNYFKVSFRNLVSNKGYSFINIGGLAAGMAVAMLIGLWIYDELTYDQYFENYDRVVRVMQHQTFNGIKGSGSAVPLPLEAALRDEYGSDFKYIALARWPDQHILTRGDVKISKEGNFFQGDYPEILSLKMIKGTRSAFKDSKSVLLSQSTAIALFGNDDPLNQSIILDGDQDVKVAGVYEDFPANTTDAGLEFMANWDLVFAHSPWIKRAATQWGNNSFQLFAELAPGADLQAVSEKIKKVKQKHAERERQFEPEIFLHPMRDWHLRYHWENGKLSGGRIQMVWLFGIIGVFVLLLACINFMNLSTARSEKRAKEVGIRMTIGSMRKQLISQFLSESFLVVFLSFILAAVIVALSLPWFNTLADKNIVIDWLNPVFWIISVCFIIVTSLLAGSYPALYLSSFQPVKVLKGTFKMGRLASIPRKVLVVVQFTVSVTLIIGTIIVYKQLQFTKNRPVGYDREGLVMMLMKTPDFHGKFDVLRNELKNTGAIREMAQSSSPLTSIWSNSGGFSWEGKDPDLQTDFGTIYITHEYGKTIGWNVKAGRDYSREFSTDSSAIIVNEAAVKFMNVKNPVGMELAWGDQKFNIIGVVEDIIAQSPYDPVKPIVYILDYGNTEWIDLRLNPEKSTSECMALIETVFKRNIPSAPFDYKFVDRAYGEKFSAEERIGKLTSVFSVLAIIISCLGIFGLASFVAEQRTKEIGVRKVLGASVLSLWKMLSRDFVILVVVSCLLAVPIACYVLWQWLNNYKYHTDIAWWIPVAATGGAIVITLVTVSYQAIRAALMSPSKSLKTE
ncbi:MAG TPA: FtsX-like permease family protein [Ohtaekwangia sp.]|uniref:FtsX-like permease family protein n=1 Tax=Ohtaekwangia sp. TaxID=2066019 RepID=UPI002F921656